MYRLLMPAICLFFQLGCANKPKQKSETQQLIDESQRFIDSFKLSKQADSMTQQIIRNAMFDTSGVAQAPVKVLTAKLVGREYTNSKDIRLMWKNVSSKKVSAVRFKWYGLNAFGEPADMGNSVLHRGFGGGFSDRILKPDKTDSGTWEIMSQDAKKVVLAWPCEVAFEDGTKWVSSK